MNDNDDIGRRDFLKTGTAAFIAARTSGLRMTNSPNETVRVGVIGVNGRGIVHAQNFSRLPNSEVAYICDVDANVIGKAVKAASQSEAIKTVSDFRRILDDKSVDAISVATPDHW